MRRYQLKYEGEHGLSLPLEARRQYFQFLDFFCSVGDPNSGNSRVLSEIERQEHAFGILHHELGEESALVGVVQNCLKNNPSDRPSAVDLVDRINALISGEKFQSKVEVIRQLSRVRRMNERLQDELSSLLGSQEKHMRDNLEKKPMLKQIKGDEEHDIDIKSKQILQGDKEVAAGTAFKDKLQFPLEFIDWEKKASLPHVAYDDESFVSLASVTVHVRGKVYFMAHSEYLMEYSPNTDTWEVDYMATVLSWRGIVLLKGKLALVSGSFKLNYAGVDVLERESDGKWQYTNPYPRLPLNRSNPACISYQKYLIVAGGESLISSLAIDRVDVLDTDSKQWYVAPPLPCSGGNVLTVVIGETLYALFRGNILVSRSLYRVSLSTLISHTLQGRNSRSHSSSIWEKLPDVPLYQTTLFSIGNMLLTAGGIYGGLVSDVLQAINLRKNKQSADIFLLNPHSYKWVKVGELPEPRCSCGCTVLPESGKLLVLGGKEPDEQHQILHSVYTATISSPLMRDVHRNSTCK